MRDLGEVLHYFIPEAERPAETPLRPAPDLAPPLPLLAVPVGPREVVRAAFVWNLAVEVARRGGAATVIAARDDDAEALWPGPEFGILGAELVLCGAEDLGSLGRVAADVAKSRAGRDEGVVLVRVPPAWLREGCEGAELLAWTLLFTRPDPRDVSRSYALAERLLAAAPEARIGVTVHGVGSLEEGRDAFAALASLVESQLGRPLASYGLLVDDLDVYRAIANRRAVGVAHPQSRAARALSDVARLLLEDARAEIRG